MTADSSGPYRQEHMKYIVIVIFFSVADGKCFKDSSGNRILEYMKNQNPDATVKK